MPRKTQGYDPDTGEAKVVHDMIEFTYSDMGNWFKIMRIDDENTLKPLESLGKPFVVFYMLLKRVVWHDCSVSIDPVCKYEISGYTLLKEGMIMKYIVGFTKGKLLTKVKGNSYMVNPQYFYVGDKKEQIELLKKFNSYVKQI